MKKGEFRRNVKRIYKLIKMRRYDEAKMELDNLRKTDLSTTVVRLETILWIKRDNGNRH